MPDALGPARDGDPRRRPSQCDSSVHVRGAGRPRGPLGAPARPWMRPYMNRRGDAGAAVVESFVVALEHELIMRRRWPRPERPARHS